jgi:hypothetical protein
MHLPKLEDLPRQLEVTEVRLELHDSSRAGRVRFLAHLREE